jgi:ribosomal protein S18 acetylase RimI-like enzyme
MKIRKAKLKDIQQISDLAVNLLKYHTDFDPYFSLASNAMEIYYKHFRRCVYSKNKLLLVAEEDNKIIGFALGELGYRPPVFAIRKIGFISDVFVDKDFRKSGIGKIFLNELCQWFKKNGLRYIELTVHVKNEIGIKVWTKYGFETYLSRQRVELEKINTILDN